MNDDLYKIVNDEREKSNSMYAIKLVERIVFALIGVVALAVLYKLLSIVSLSPKIL